MITQKKEEIKRFFAQGYKAVPVFHELLIDECTPVGIYSTMKAHFKNCSMLESVVNSEKWGRYSFIGFDPKLELRVSGEKTELISQDGSITEEKTGDPSKIINRLLEERLSPVIPGKPRLTGGLIGYFGYDTARYFERRLTGVPEDDLKMPDIDLFMYDELIAYDHLANTAVIIGNIYAGGDIDSQYDERVRRAESIAAILENPVMTIRRRSKKAGEISVTSNMTKERFIEMVETVREHIRNGDVSQTVISQRFRIDNPPAPFDVYRILRSSNPSPYLFYFETKDYAVAGASPEMLINVTNGVISTKPIAGTAARGETEEEDEELVRNLISDEKERAEHTMLVDLGRNDIGKVCDFGTVRVTGFMRVERYARVSHLVSDVEGVLSADKKPLDALIATLPAGTLSGAPKIRAMEIIDSLEPEKRGLYGGTVGHLSFGGDIDACIAIRTALFKNGKAYIQAGAGIVYDSVPEKEYEETKSKAQALIEAVKTAAAMG